MENRRGYSGLIVLLTVLWALLLGARAQQQEIQWVGDNVTLVPQYTRDLTEITWRRNDTIVVEVKLNPLEEFIFNLPRDRVTIDETNGALTIRNLNINDSGNYRAVALLKDGTEDITEITLTVRAQQVEEKWVGSEVILKPQYSGMPSDMIWRKGTQEVAHMKLSPREEIIFSLLVGRATIDRTNGALTINNLTIEDSGLFEAVVLVNGISYNTKINLTVYAQQVQEKWLGDYVILKPQYIGEPSEITWRKGIQKVAHMKLRSPREEIIFAPFVGRATIDRTNGALTIRALTIGDSGPYKAEVVLVNGSSYYTKINLNLRAQQQEIQWVGREVTLVPQYTEALKEITWRRNNTKVVEIKLNPLEELIFKLPRDRVSVCTNGALTIKNLTINDIGNYTSEALLEDGTNDKTEIMLTLREYSCPHGGIIAAGVAALSIIITVAAFYAFSKKTSDPSQWLIVFVFFTVPPLIIFLFILISELWMCYSAEPSGPPDENIPNILVILVCPIIIIIMIIVIPVLWMYYRMTQSKKVKRVGDDVTLKPFYIGSPSEITWKKDGNKLVDMEVTPPEDPIFYRLKDRATIDRTNGRLTIRDLTVEDSGLYQAQVLVKGFYQYTARRLSVRESYQCITVKFKTKVQPDGKVIYPFLTIHNLKPEDGGQYFLKVFQCDGEKHKLHIKEMNGIVNIRTEGDRVTLTWPDTGKMTNITWKKNRVTLFQWKVYGLKLHTNNITLEQEFVTVNDPKGRGSYKVNVHSTENHINNTSQLEDSANNEGNESPTNRKAEWEAVEMVPLADNGPPESQALDSVTLNPNNVAEKKITWMKDGQLVKIDGERIKFGLCGDLTIKNVTAGDKGKYTIQCKGQDQEQEFILL